jgi:hypothetical protein
MYILAYGLSLTRCLDKGFRFYPTGHSVVRAEYKFPWSVVSSLPSSDSGNF